MIKQGLNRGAKTGANLSRKKVWLFRFISIFLPVLLLLILEGFLRLFSYGKNYDLFVEYQGNANYLVLNADAPKRYFTSSALAPAGNKEIFKRVKDAKTTRIFVLGESTTIGYPYFHNGSFSRWLQYRLTNTNPERHFEIINLSLTAVNSYTILGFAKELVKYEPDAVMVYSGHNEYYGALGVGSTNSMGSSRKLVELLLWLKKFRVTQLLISLYQKVAGTSNPIESTDEGKSLMEVMVKSQQIPYKSELYNKGVNQFTGNMDEVLALFNKCHIPVFVSNLVSNERDLKPLNRREGMDSSLFPGFNQNYQKGIEAFIRTDYNTAYGYFTSANKIYGSHSMCNYYLAKLAYLQGKFPEAKKYFSDARDFDELRFRAPGQFNEIIAGLCHKYSYAHLVDTKAAFDSAAINHIIGNDLMLEHVHPNLKGYAIISDAFYQALINSRMIAVSLKKKLDISWLLRNMPITRMDSLSGLYRIGKMKKRWPFNEITTGIDSFSIESVEEKLAFKLVGNQIGWHEAMEELYSYYVGTGNLSAAGAVTRGLALEYPGDASLYERSALIYGKLNELENAAVYFKTSFDIAPSMEKARYLFAIYFKLDDPGNAMLYLDYAIRHSGMSANLLPIKKLGEEIIELQKKAPRDSVNLETSNEIAERYYKMGNKEVAVRYLNNVLKKDNSNKKALLLVSQINNIE